VVIGRDIPEKGKKAVVVESNVNNLVGTRGEKSQPSLPYSLPPKQDEPQPFFQTGEERKVARATLEVIKKFERLNSSHELQKEGIQEEIVQKVKDVVGPMQGSILPEEKIDIKTVVEKTTRLYEEMSIDIPKIVVLPKGEVSCGYESFTLNTQSINLQPVSQDILIQHLHDRERHTMQSGNGIAEEKRPEDYLVRGLIDFDDISYDDHSDLLYDLAGQVVDHLRGYLKSENTIINVLQYHQQTLVNLIHAQMQDHFVEIATSYEAHVTKGFRTLRSNNYTADSDEDVRDFRVPVPAGERSRIKSMLFDSFKKCLYPIQKFDSDSERRFAVILENDNSVLKWFKPAKNDFQIHYSHAEGYEPDFVVETEDCKYLCEPKRTGEMENETVQVKAKAAAVWCDYATRHAANYRGKPWKYLLIPHDQITEQKTLAGLEAAYLYEKNI